MSDSDIYNVQCLEIFLRRRVRHHLVNDEIKHTPCVVVVGPRRTICRNLPVGNVVTLLSVREIVSNRVEFKNLYFFVIVNNLAFFQPRKNTVSSCSVRSFFEINTDLTIFQLTCSITA